MSGCWREVGSLTMEAYCGKHGREFGWPCRRYRKKREPQVDCLAEGGYLVRHCADIEEARKLVMDYAPGDEWTDLSKGRVIWCRILGTLPGSPAEDAGWSWEYRHASGPARGVFRAVEFLP